MHITREAAKGGDVAWPGLCTSALHAPQSPLRDIPWAADWTGSDGTAEEDMVSMQLAVLLWWDAYVEARRRPEDNVWRAIDVLLPRGCVVVRSQRTVSTTNGQAGCTDYGSSMRNSKQQNADPNPRIPCRAGASMLARFSELGSMLPVLILKLYKRQRRLEAMRRWTRQLLPTEL